MEALIDTQHLLHSITGYLIISLYDKRKKKQTKMSSHAPLCICFNFDAETSKSWWWSTEIESCMTNTSTRRV